MTDTRFAAGPSTAYLTDSVLALSTEPDVDDELSRLCVTTTEWAALADGARVRRVAALVMHDAARVRLAVADHGSVVVDTVDGLRRFDGTSTWRTDTIDGARSVTLMVEGRGDDAVAAFRTDAGVVPASAVSRRLAAEAIDPTDPFEVLFGHTVPRSVEAAAVRPYEAERSAPTALGVLVFSTGDRVMVDRPIVLGRNPRQVGDVQPDAPRPRLVELALAGISRRHAVIRPDRWSASIDDLGSANGTFVALPGRPAVPVRPGHPVELVPGAVVDLGGEVSFTVEEAA